MIRVHFETDVWNMWDTSPRIIRYPINCKYILMFFRPIPRFNATIRIAWYRAASCSFWTCGWTAGVTFEVVGGSHGVFFRPDVHESNSTTRKHESEISWDIMFLYVFCTWICCLRISQLGSLVDAQTFWDALEVFCDRRSCVAASPDGTSVMSLALRIPHWPRLCWWSFKRPPTPGFQASSVQSANLFAPEHIRSWSNFAVCQGQYSHMIEISYQIYQQQSLSIS